MYYQTVKTPSKCSHNLWIIKVNKKPEITLPAVHCIYVIKFQLESLLLTYHIFSYFDSHSLFPVKIYTYKSNQSFSCKAPSLAFSFLPPVRFEIFTAGFFSRIFISPPVHWLRKYDCSSLQSSGNSSMWHQQSNNIHFLKTSKFFKKNHRYIFQLMNGGSVGTILQLLIFLFKAFATKETLLHISLKQDDCGMSLLHTFSLLLLMNPYNWWNFIFYQTKIRMKIRF